MAEDDRVTRPPPERTAPIRNRFVRGKSGSSAGHGAREPGGPERASNGHGKGAGDADWNGAPYTLGSAVDESMRAARDLARSADAAMAGAVERGVESAYTVIEEYMQRGRSAARTYRQRAYGRGEMSERRGFDELAAVWGPFSAPWLQMMRLWSESMSTFMGTPNATEWMAPFFPGGSAWGAGAPGPRNVRVQVASPHRVTVQVDLDSGVGCGALTVDAPAHVQLGKDAPALEDVDLAAADGRIEVGVTVPPGNPPGRYQGAILDAGGARRGTLTVDVEAPPKAPAQRRRAATRKQP